MSRSDVRTVTRQKSRSDKGSLRYEEHVVHACEHRLCPVSCELCKRLCSGDHLHGLNADQNHLCGCASRYLLPATLFMFLFLAKNTLVVRYVRRRVYATSTQPLNPLRQRLLAGMKPSNTPRLACRYLNKRLIILPIVQYTQGISLEAVLCCFPKVYHVSCEAPPLRQDN